MRLTPLQRMGALNLIVMAAMLAAGEWGAAAASACAALIGLWPQVAR